MRARRGSVPEPPAALRGSGLGGEPPAATRARCRRFRALCPRSRFAPITDGIFPNFSASFFPSTTSNAGQCGVTTSPAKFCFDREFFPIDPHAPKKSAFFPIDPFAFDAGSAAHSSEAARLTPRLEL